MLSSNFSHYERVSEGYFQLLPEGPLSAKAAGTVSPQRTSFVKGTSVPRGLINKINDNHNN